MTYKAAVAELELGGGKAVIIGDSKRAKTPELLRAHGRFVDTLGGRYITAEDVGIGVEDMEYVYEETKHVTGIRSSPHGSGDPSPVTAYGVYNGIKASCKKKLGTEELKGVRVAVQGAGHVGYYLCENLAAEGALLTICDIDSERVQKVVEDFGAAPVAPDAIYDVECDVFSPCALGAIINDGTLRRLRCQVVAGGANNQLDENRHGDALDAKGILYAPDYVINAGGAAAFGLKAQGERDEAVLNRRIDGLADTLREIFVEAAANDESPAHAARRRVARTLERARQLG
jgi:leucine dehydrogenase